MADEATQATPANPGKKVGAIALVALGAIANVVGIAGAVKAWGTSTTVVVTGQASSSASSVPQPAPTTTTTVKPVGTPAQFVADLDRAIRDHDEAFLISRLHPAVLARYGATACRAFIATIRNHFEIRGPASAPRPFSYTTDGKTTVIPDVVGVPVAISQPGMPTATAILHTVPVDGTYRWFTDCSQTG